MSLNEEYRKGIAFILEGATEKVFYKELLNWIARKNQSCFEKGDDFDNGDIYYIWNVNSEKYIIKFNVVGTVTQISHSGKWFLNRCSKLHKIPWTVFLCYDTDNSENDISKFYQDDWGILRNDLKKAKAEKIFDLAASADIEDIMLYDIVGICKYLGIDVPEKLSGKKGKTKMKRLFRSCGNTYHEGDRAESMIKSLDFQTIVDNAPLEFEDLIAVLIKDL